VVVYVTRLIYGNLLTAFLMERNEWYKMEMGFCSCCGNYTVIHGNPGGGNPRGIGRYFMLCDECCPCYNHCPPLGMHYDEGKYFNFSMVETWTQRNMNALFSEKEAEK